MNSIDNNAENTLLDVYEYYLDKAVSSVKADKTIPATIVSCENEEKGKYKVNYQNSYFYAYSTSPDTKYSAQAMVYVLIPEGDFSNTKKIISSIENNATDYAILVDDTEDAYEKVSQDFAIDKTDEEMSLCSYSDIETLVIYDATAPQLYKNITIDETAAKIGMEKAKYFMYSAEFRNTLDDDQIDAKGNFGIKIYIDVENEQTKDIRTLEYILDAREDMIGNPWVLPEYIQFTDIKPMEEKFVRVSRIEFFKSGFILDSSQTANDIFVKNFEFYAANKLESSSLTGYSLELITMKNTFFIDGKPEELPITARIKKSGVEITKDTDAQYYWFMQDLYIDNNSKYYNQNGGVGWRCLNNRNEETGVIKYTDLDGKEVEETITSVVWDADAASYKNFNISYNLCTSQTTYFKCVVIYEDVKIEKLIDIQNLDANYNITLTSNQTTFYNSNGSADLTCKLEYRVTKNDPWTQITDGLDNYEFKWGKTQTNGSTLILDESGISYTVDSKTINGNVNYSVAVYKKNGEERIYLGTSVVTLTNTYGDPKVWRLRINPSSKTYKYNENGLSPIIKENENTSNTILEPFSFTIIDPESGKEYDTEYFKTHECKIKWTIPLVNTLLVIDKEAYGDHYSDNGQEEEEGKEAVAATECYITDYLTLDYTIANVYSDDKNNTIKLDVVFDDKIFNSDITVGFTKDGDLGTNGTEYYATLEMITPIEADRYRQDIPIVKLNTFGDNTLHPLNFSNSYGKHFCVKFWKNGKCIWDSLQNKMTTDEGGTISDVTWMMIDAIYREDSTQESFYSIDDGKLSINNFFDITTAQEKAPYNIMKVTFKYETPGKVDGDTIDTKRKLLYYGVLPIVTIIKNDTRYAGFDIGLQKNGWWSARYNTDLINPKHDSKSIFQIDLYDNGIPELNIEDIGITWSDLPIENTNIFNNIVIKNSEELLQEQCIYDPAPVMISDATNTALKGTLHFLNDDDKRDIHGLQNNLNTLKDNYNNALKILNEMTEEAEKQALYIESKEDYNIAYDGLLLAIKAYKSLQNEINKQECIDKANAITPTLNKLKDAIEIYYGYSKNKDWTEDSSSKDHLIEIKHSEIFIGSGIANIPMPSGSTYSTYIIPEELMKDGTLIPVKDSAADSYEPQEKKVNDFHKVLYGDEETINSEKWTIKMIAKIKNFAYEFMSIHFPIYSFINKYENGALNEWDGNGIDIGGGKVIRAPQMIAGKKNEDNTFTGLVMGVENHVDGVKKSTQIGLIGYNKTEQTIFLDAETGKAEFGKYGAGRIVINPNDNKAEIYSGNYQITDGDPTQKVPLPWNGKYEVSPTYDLGKASGMKIDFTTPYIHFGSNKFFVTPLGEMHSVAGKIGGFEITNEYFHSVDGPTSLSDIHQGAHGTIIMSGPNGGIHNCAEGQMTEQKTTELFTTISNGLIKTNALRCVGKQPQTFIEINDIIRGYHKEGWDNKGDRHFLEFKENNGKTAEDDDGEIQPVYQRFRIYSDRIEIAQTVIGNNVIMRLGNCIPDDPNPERMDTLYITGSNKSSANVSIDGNLTVDKKINGYSLSDFDSRISKLEHKIETFTYENVTIEGKTSTNVVINDAAEKKVITNFAALKYNGKIITSNTGGSYLVTIYSTVSNSMASAYIHTEPEKDTLSITMVDGDEKNSNRVICEQETVSIGLIDPISITGVLLKVPSGTHTIRGYIIKIS